MLTNAHYRQPPGTGDIMINSLPMVINTSKIEIADFLQNTGKPAKRVYEPFFLTFVWALTLKLSNSEPETRTYTTVPHGFLLNPRAQRPSRGKRPTQVRLRFWPTAGFITGLHNPVEVQGVGKGNGACADEMSKLSGNFQPQWLPVSQIWCRHSLSALHGQRNPRVCSRTFFLSDCKANCLSGCKPARQA